MPLTFDVRCYHAFCVLPVLQRDVTDLFVKRIVRDVQWADCPNVAAESPPDSTVITDDHAKVLLVR